MKYVYTLFKLLLLMLAGVVILLVIEAVMVLVFTIYFVTLLQII